MNTHRAVVSLRPSATRAFAAVALLLAAQLPGCTTTTTQDSDPKAGRATVASISVDPLVPGSSERNGLPPEDLVAAVARLDIAGRTQAAERLVRREPGRMLAGLGVAHSDPATLRRAGLVYEHATGGAPADGGWAALIDERTIRPDSFDRYERVKTQFMDALRIGDSRAARAFSPLEVPSGAPGASVLEVQARALDGFADLADGDPEDAIESFEEGLRAAGSERPFERSRLGLLKAQAEQAARGAAEPSTWTAAVLAATEIEGLTDPIFWERAIALLPGETAWPEAALVRAQHAVLPDGGAPGTAPQESAEALIGGWQGLQLLEIGRPGDALLALSKAQALASQPRTRGRLGLAQAQALIALGRPGDAIARLSPLTEDADPGVALPSLALAGALEIKLARPERARVLLERAVLGEAEPGFTGRTEAEANLGLTCLLLGDRDEGLNRLHSAQARFEVERDYDALARSLRNELAYANQARLSDEAARLRDRLESVERR